MLSSFFLLTPFNAFLPNSRRLYAWNCEGGGEGKKHFDEQVQEKMEKISTVRPTDIKQCFEVSQKNT